MTRSTRLALFALFAFVAVAGTGCATYGLAVGAPAPGMRISGVPNAPSVVVGAGPEYPGRE